MHFSVGRVDAGLVLYVKTEVYVSNIGPWENMGRSEATCACKYDVPDGVHDVQNQLPQQILTIAIA